jgi:hypothetical protein
MSPAIGGGSPDAPFHAKVLLAWDAPRRNADGSELTDLAGYRVYLGKEPGRYRDVFEIGDSTRHELDLFSSGRYYFTVSAYNSRGIESDLAPEVSFEVD